jgi:hypothetical protein
MIFPFKSTTSTIEILFSVSAIKMKLFVIEFCPGFEPKDVPERVIQGFLFAFSKLKEKVIMRSVV